MSVSLNAWISLDSFTKYLKLIEQFHEKLEANWSLSQNTWSSLVSFTKYLKLIGKFHETLVAHWEISRNTWIPLDSFTKYLKLIGRFQELLKSHWTVSRNTWKYIYSNCNKFVTEYFIILYIFLVQVCENLGAESVVGIPVCFTVCNYGKWRNVVNYEKFRDTESEEIELPYVNGKTGSQCPTGKTCL